MMMNEPKSWDTLYKRSQGVCNSPFNDALHSKIMEIIPDDCESILDAGCGGGALMYFLAKEGKYRVQGIDQSHEGVRFAVEKLHLTAQVGDITDLRQFLDNSFDLVLCSEVLEHLPKGVLESAIKELARVAKKYLITSNPFHERLSYYQLTCNHCLTRYHPAGHIHSIDESFMLPIMSQWADSISFFYSGEREYCSRLYAAALRTVNYRLLNIEISCPLCGSEVPYKKWGIPVRITGYMYRVVQRMLKRIGLYRPANIITLVKVKS